MTIIGTKWVFRNKLDENGIVSQNKAMLVAQGYNQQEGIDYDETYALVARLESIRILLAYARALDFKLFQMDVKSAFLNGFINEEKFGLEESKLMKTPMSSNTKLKKDEEYESVDSTKYRGMIGRIPKNLLTGFRSCASRSQMRPSQSRQSTEWNDDIIQFSEEACSQYHEHIHQQSIQVPVDPSCLQSPFNFHNELFAPCHILFCPEARIHTQIEPLDLEFCDSII
ncbi:retrovirus-related pol polyprotein from transposon TNT 1-94 [Tanacetum coccineum]|uniref:Retrovirus-related pol polyprotein from transposon TNT 1-94 n=1 Tax=Tanacetum coccineum TaxID=301880 RepID=A0ABQ4YDP2_9ASTR